MTALSVRHGWWFLAALAAGIVLGCNETKPPEVVQNKFRPAGTPDPVAPAQPAPTVETPAVNGQPDPKVGETADPVVGKKGPQTPSDDPPPDPRTVPDGTPAQLLTYIQKLEGQLRGLDAQAEQLGIPPLEVKAIRAQYRASQLQAVEKILAHKDGEKDKLQAANLKLAFLQELTALGSPPSPTAYQDYVDSLVKSEDPKLAELGRVGVFAANLESFVKKSRAAQVAAQSKDEEFEPTPELSEEAKKLAGEIEQLLANKEASDSIFEIASQGAMALFQSKQFRAASGLFDAIHARFKDAKDEQVAFRAARLGDQSFVAKLIGAISGDETLLPEVMEAFTKRLAMPDDETYELAQQALMMLEMSGHVTEAKQLLDLMVKGFAETKNPETKQALATLKEKAEKRFDLVGKPIVVEGIRTADGKPFDWKPYEGKVVLVDLWATWCGPCLQEIPNILKNYEKYHDQGFDVVGINLDEEPEALPTFSKQLPRILGVAAFPWATVVQQDLTKAGMEKDPNAARFGVEAIPFMLLVGRDGKVIAMHPRGRKLGQLLAKEFPAKTPEGKPEEKPAEKAPEKPASAPVESGAAAGAGRVTFVAFDPPVADAQGSDAAEEVNPYSPDAELTTLQLVEFLFNMDDKPKAIRMRPGFCAAIVEACDRIMAGQPSPKQREIAATTKCVYLHRDASLGDDKADKLLTAFVITMKEDTTPAIARWVRLVTLEQEALAADKLDKAKLPELIAKLKSYFEAETLVNDHLRLASACVGAINLLEDGKEREKHFQEIGTVLGKSKDKQLASYGKKLAKPPEGEGASDLVGKPLNLKGQLVDGKEFDWKEYRGKYVLVDFWATWCGPCKREMPHVKALFEKYKEQGVEVVGVSLDEDVDDLKTYIEENNIPWPTLNGEDASNTAKEYGVRGIPTFMLIDKEGKILGVGHAVAPLEAQLAKLLEK